MKQKLHLSITALAMAFALAASSTLWAQQPASETLQQKVGLPSQAAPPSPASTSDADLGDIGVVQKFPKPATFTFSTSQEFFYTDNVFYTNINPVGSTAYLGSYTGSFVPYSLRDWTPRITAQYNMVRYGSVSSGDFDNENLAFSSQYVFSQDRAWSWTATVDLSRFTAPHSATGEFYKEVVYDNQISYVKQLCKETPLFFVGAYDLAYHEAHPADFDRLDNSLSFSLAWYPLPEVSVGPFIRPGLRTYPTDTSYQHDRDDFNLSEGFDVTWTPWKYVSMSADFSHTDDFSSASNQSYADTIPGVAVSGTIKF